MGQTSLREALRLAPPFLRLGATAFGGPAAAIAMMEDEFVTRQGWLERQHFLDLVGATNLIPGPNSTEMVMHLGYERAGWLGLVVAGTCFIVPAVTITALLAWVYVSYGSLPEVAPLLSGIKPTVLVIIAGAVWKLGRQAVKGPSLGFLLLAVAAASLAGLSEIWALLLGGVLGMLLLRATGKGPPKGAIGLLPPLFLASTRRAVAATASVAAATTGASISTSGLFLTFLKIGSILYGGGYVLIAFLQDEFVAKLGLLTQAQLLDAVAIGQFTPGPILSTATFIGYILKGTPGAASATVGIFLPSFLFVLASRRLIPRLRQSRWAAAFLDAVNVSSVALMLSVLVQLGAQVMNRPASWAIAALAGLGLFGYKLNAAWLVLGGAVLGWILLVAT